VYYEPFKPIRITHNPDGGGGLCTEHNRRYSGRAEKHATKRSLNVSRHRSKPVRERSIGACFKPTPGRIHRTPSDYTTIGFDRARVGWIGSKNGIRIRCQKDGQELSCTSNETLRSPFFKRPNFYFEKPAVTHLHCPYGIRRCFV